MSPNVRCTRIFIFISQFLMFPHNQNSKLQDHFCVYLTFRTKLPQRFTRAPKYLDVTLFHEIRTASVANSTSSTTRHFYWSASKFRVPIAFTETKVLLFSIFNPGRGSRGFQIRQGFTVTYAVVWCICIKPRVTEGSALERWEQRRSIDTNGRAGRNIRLRL